MAARKAKPKAKSNRGGPRPGSGRKPRPANEIEKEIVDAFRRANTHLLPKLFENLTLLANGGYRRVERKYEPSDDPTSTALVLVEKKVSVAEPDRAANVYLIDRVLGKPKQSIEVTETDASKPRQIIIPDADNRPEPDATS